MYATRRRRHARHHKVFIYIFLISINSEFEIALPVCVSVCPYRNLDLQ